MFMDKMQMRVRAAAQLIGLFIIVALAACTGGSTDDDPAKGVAETVALPPEPGPDASAFEKYEYDKALKDRDYWAQELEAQAHDQTFIALWDKIRNSSGEKIDVLGTLQFDEIVLPSFGEDKPIEFGISKQTSQGAGKTLSHEEWTQYLQQLKGEGYTLVQCEFHHQNFRKVDGAYNSEFSSEFHISNSVQKRRYILKGVIGVVWTDKIDKDGNPVPQKLDLSKFYVMHRDGRQPFQSRYLPGALSSMITANTPLLVSDLNGDGMSDVVLPNINKLLINKGGFDFSSQEISPNMPDEMFSGVLADFTGDGLADLVVGGTFAGKKPWIADGKRNSAATTGPHLFLFERKAGDKFADVGVSIFGPDSMLVRPTSLTAGDVDGDGDLDLFFSQYKQPYRQGQLPYPYYDANDGDAAFMLINEGRMQFSDQTEARGLGGKRYRRTYANSLVDLDGDFDLDLLVVSDFSGVDMYYNDGSGVFTDVTDTNIDERFLFGMSHTFGDFNMDGAIDFYVLGMSSTTARRLEAMGLGRPDQPDKNEKRMDMAYGNRMYMAGADHKFNEPSFRDDVARSGWSWGCTAFDFDNDGDQDIYVTNGHVSRESAVDYCTHFWRDDIYRLDSDEDPDMASAYSKVFDLENQQGYSWNGFEKNHLFVNRDGGGFVNASYLLGGALVEDCRGVISEDFNGDGKMDLMVVTFRYPNDHRIVMLQNEAELDNNWIGVRLAEHKGGQSAIGARIELHTSRGIMPAVITTGDSFLSQHSFSKHFGLGRDIKVEKVVVRWLDGTQAELAAPAINEVHEIRTPAL